MMQTNFQDIYSLSPQAFQYSLDWRFLLPLSDPASIHVAFEWEPELNVALDLIGIPISNHHFTPHFEDEQKASLQTFVLPLGLPHSWITARNDEQTEFYRSIRDLICPGGYFLLGFQSFWTPRPDTRYHAPTPSRAASQLRQAGFQSLKFFGVLPDLHIPEYIFELSDRSISFALLHRFRQKPVLLNMLQALARTIGAAHMLDLFPCYFVLAVA